MSRHSFDPAIAEKVGVNAAVIFQNICYWCERNAIKARNIRDGNAWTYNTVKELATMFSYLTDKQVRTALEKLEKSGLLEVGNYNKENRDRTKWYALNREGSPFAHLVTPHLPKRAEHTFAQKGKALPDSKPDNKHTPIVPKGTDLFSDNSQQESESSNQPDEIEKGFEEFWNEIWPSHKRKIGKDDCAKVYRMACEGRHAKADKITPQALNAATKRYIASVRDQEYLKGTLPWLRQPGWEPFVREEYHLEDLTPRQRGMLERGTCPPSLQDDTGQPNAVGKYWLRRFGHKVAE